MDLNKQNMGAAKTLPSAFANIVLLLMKRCYLFSIGGKI